MADEERTGTEAHSDCDLDEVGSVDSDDINPSRLLSDLQGVYRDHLMQINTADEERDETYKVKMKAFIAPSVQVFPNENL